MGKPKHGIVIAGLLTVAITTAACGGGKPSASHSTTTTGAPPSTTDLTATASAAYASAFNTMESGLNAQIPAQNAADTDPSGATTAINTEVTVLQTFDTAIEAIQFPPADQSDVQAVLNADAAWEQGLGTLAVNTNDTANYNSVFDTVQPEQTAATAAQDALGRDLGLSITSSGS